MAVPRKIQQQITAGLLAYLLTYDLPEAVSWRMQPQAGASVLELTGVLPFESAHAALSNLRDWAVMLTGAELTFDVFDNDDDAGGRLQLAGTYSGIPVRLWIGLADADEVSTTRALLPATASGKEAAGA